MVCGDDGDSGGALTLNLVFRCSLFCLPSGPGTVGDPRRACLTSCVKPGIVLLVLVKDPGVFLVEDVTCWVGERKRAGTGRGGLIGR